MSNPNRKHGLKVTQASDVAPGTLSLKADVVVIGSGAGGGVAAYELAKSGKKVIVLEAGPYVPSEKFTEMLAVTMGQMFADGGGQSNTTGDMSILQGVCVGGSTVVNAAVCFRTPDQFLKKWAKDYGLTNLTTEVLTPHFEKIEKYLSIKRNTPSETSQDAELLIEGFEKAGISWDRSPRNIKDCALSAACLAGCYSDRKQSMLITCLPWAVELGAEIYADTRVVKVREESGKAIGIDAQIIDPATGEKKVDLSIDAPLIVLAAGAVQTPILLLRSEIGNSSGQVGKNLSCHPTLSISGQFADLESNFLGAWHSVYSDQFAMPQEGGFLLLQAVQEPLEASFQVEAGTGKANMDYVANSKNYTRLISEIHDRNQGEILWEDGIKKIKYDLVDEDFLAMKKGMKRAAEVLFAAGAEKIMLPTSNQAEASSREEADKIIDALENERARYRYAAYHPSGTCRMGTDIKNSVVGPNGETHDVKGLYIVDASIIPTSFGLNPSETIYALSSYICDQINS
ncbi:MAG: GMC family oxidoreductase [Rhizobiaceae bacterium]